MRSRVSTTMAALMDRSATIEYLKSNLINPGLKINKKLSVANKRKPTKVTEHTVLTIDDVFSDLTVSFPVLQGLMDSDVSENAEQHKQSCTQQEGSRLKDTNKDCDELDDLARQIELQMKEETPDTVIDKVLQTDCKPNGEDITYFMDACHASEEGGILYANMDRVCKRERHDTSNREETEIGLKDDIQNISSVVSEPTPEQGTLESKDLTGCDRLSPDREGTCETTSDSICTDGYHVDDRVQCKIEDDEKDCSVKQELEGTPNSNINAKDGDLSLLDKLRSMIASSYSSSQCKPINQMAELPGEKCPDVSDLNTESRLPDGASFEVINIIPIDEELPASVNTAPVLKSEYERPTQNRICAKRSLDDRGVLRDLTNKRVCQRLNYLQCNDNSLPQTNSEPGRYNSNSGRSKRIQAESRSYQGHDPLSYPQQWTGMQNQTSAPLHGEYLNQHATAIVQPQNTKSSGCIQSTSLSGGQFMNQSPYNTISHPSNIYLNQSNRQDTSHNPFMQAAAPPCRDYESMYAGDLPSIHRGQNSNPQYPTNHYYGTHYSPGFAFKINNTDALQSTRPQQSSCQWKTVSRQGLSSSNKIQPVISNVNPSSVLVHNNINSNINNNNHMFAGSSNTNHNHEHYVTRTSQYQQYVGYYPQYT